MRSEPVKVFGLAIIALTDVGRIQAEPKEALAWPAVRFTQTFVPTSVPGRKDKLVVHWIGNAVRSVEPRGRYLPMFDTDAQKASR